MILIRVVLVPFWRQAPPADFRRWFRAHSPSIRNLMLPLGLGAAASSAASAATTRPVSPAAVAAAVCTAGVVGVTATVNEPANARFVAENGLSDEETRELLARWARWHDVRVGLGVVGAVAAALVAAGRG